MLPDATKAAGDPKKLKKQRHQNGGCGMVARTESDNWKKRGAFDENAAIDVLMKVSFFSPGWTKCFVV